MVEMAIVLPLLLTLLVGLLDFGIVIGHWQETEHKASTGARYAAVGRTPVGFASLEEFLADGNAELTICIAPETTLAIGQPVTVTVSRTEELTPILDVGPDITVTGKAQMRIERLPAPTDPEVFGGSC